VRIGLISPPWVAVPPPGYGGTEAVVDRLARGAVAAGHDVLLFATGDSTCPVPTRYLFARAQLRRMGDRDAEERHLTAAYEAVGDCDIVHDHTMLGPARARTLSGIPVVTTCHGPLTPAAVAWYTPLVDRVSIIAISHAQRAQAPMLPVERVIHHGVDPAAFPVGRGDGGYVVFLGRMALEKGPDRAIAAAREAGVHIRLAAKMWTSEERRYFAERVRPSLGSDAVFVGEVAGDAKLRLLGDALALLNPIAWAEPFGLVMVEALACATPVLAFRSGAAPEIVDHGRTGFVCDDEHDMAAAIGRVGLLDRLACRRAVEERFSAAAMVSAHLRLYQELIDRGSGRRHAGPRFDPRRLVEGGRS
jgi:glycosyltransferase involved in cell wall biosynthesis